MTLRWSFVFLVIAIISAVVAFLDVVSSLTSMARISFFIFIGLFLVSMISFTAALKARMYDEE